MNSEESPGGSSCDGQENGDGFDGSERPLKKARYAWQVKGKYHLKNEKNEPSKISTAVSTAPEMAGPSGSESHASASHIGQDMTKEINENINNSNSGTCAHEPDKSVLGPSTGNLGSEDKPDNDFTPNATEAQDITTPQNNLRSQEHTDFLRSLNLTDSPMARTPDGRTALHALLSSRDTEDHIIASWQCRQLIRVNLDNSINRILENMNPEEVDRDIAILEQDVECIENEGILMAISAHGLQNTTHSHDSFYSASSTINGGEESGEECDLTLNNIEFTLTNQLRNIDNETIPPPTFHGTSSLNLNYENLHETDAPSDDVEIVNENNHDFLEAAVSTAILRKGLTTSGTAYG